MSQYRLKGARDLRKGISIIIFLGLLVGYLLLFGINAYVFSSIIPIRIHPQGFSQSMPDNQTIRLEGQFIVENDHQNSVDISDFQINFTIFAENGTELISQTNTQDLIPRQQNTTVSLGFDLSLADITLEKFYALNNSDYIIFDMRISFKYFLYGIRLGFDLQADLGGGP
ncbi:MAG: hypothetical protein BAJALOKI2v1_310003 [Promethearchaeota archaeon]|nr:MAG: hypothetical protein BAJALOKI2v1_310003 [Candidatus Lokiarchaeota archaeon]